MRREDVGDYDILMAFDIDADRQSVRRALTEEDGIRSWWTTRTELRGGGEGASRRELRTSFPDVPQPFEFEVSEAPDRIGWTTGGFPPWWAGTTITFDLGPRDDQPGTHLLFGHRGYERDNPVIPIVTPAWAQILLRLKAYAETGTRQPFFDF